MNCTQFLFHPLIHIPNWLANWKAYSRYCKSWWLWKLLAPPNWPEWSTIVVLVPDRSACNPFVKVPMGLIDQLFSLKGNVDFIPVKNVSATVDRVI